MAVSHEIFISHSSKESELAKAICASLEAADRKCWIAPRDIEAGEAFDEAIMRGLLGSRMVLVVFSQATNNSEHVKKELLQAQDKGKIILPVRIEDVRPSERLEYVLTGIQWFDAFSGPFAQHLERLTAQVVRRLGPVAGNVPSPAQDPVSAARTEVKQAAPAVKPNGKRVMLIHKRNAQPDGHVLDALEDALKTAGFEVFNDRESQIGLKWAERIASNMANADFVVPIISSAAASSEMVSYEIDTACTAHNERGRPIIFPVSIGPAHAGAGTEPGADPRLHLLQTALHGTHVTDWLSEADDKAVADAVLRHLVGGESTSIRVDPRKISLRGAVPLEASYYIPRPSDQDLSDALQRRDTIVLVKGGRQMGKTSLVARGLREARSSGATVVFTDLQKLNAGDLADIRSFYVAVARRIADALDFDEDKDIEKNWREVSAPSVNFERYLKRQVMPAIPDHLFWALDEVDRLFTTTFGSEVFGLLRSWHNERAADPDAPWSRLTMLISYATEAHLFIADPNQSPFNVGTRLELRDFTFEQEKILNQMFDSPIATPSQMQHFSELLNGHPYLVTRALQELAMNKQSFETFASLAGRDEGPFGDHLRRILVMLCLDPRMIDGVKAVLNGSDELTMDSFYRLRAAGLVVGEGAFNARMRCKLYASYLENHLREAV